MSSLADAELLRLLDDDVPCGDLTTESLGIATAPARLEFRARQAMTLGAVEEAVRLFCLAGGSATSHRASGDALAAGELILEAQGTAGALHRGWKAAQVLVEWASGIATATAAIVAAARGLPVACTRKNVPGTKALSIKAVRAGGATMHRLGLSETLLIFAGHRLFLEETPGQTVSRLKRAEPEKKIVVEVGNIEEAHRWSSAGADVLQLEKFTVTDVVALVEYRRLASADYSHVLFAAAGGINAANAGAYADAGADLLVTSAPYTAPPRDVAVAFMPC